MPSSLIIVALVVAWLVVLVPMIVRKRQEIARTADSALAARVVRSGDTEEEEPVREDLAPEADVVEETEEYAEAAQPEPRLPDPVQRYRPGRGGFDPEAAAVIARAKYAFRQRVVLAMIVGAVVTGVLAGFVFPILWWPHGAVDVALVVYLGYLRRQVRIEQEIRERRLARMQAARRLREHQRPYAAPPAEAEEPEDSAADRRTLVAETPATPPVSVTHPGARVVDVDDEDPAFDELDQPGNLPYRRAAGE
jgi:hypothetical protein